VGVPAVNQPPSILWPTVPGLPCGAHVWVVGGSLGPEGECELVAADHVVPLARHPVGARRLPVSGPPGTPAQQVERLAPAVALAVGRQYQLRVRVRSRSHVVGVWTVTPPFAPPAVARCAVLDHHPRPTPGEPTHAPLGGAPPWFVALEVDAPAIVHVRASGGEVIEVVEGAAVIAVGGPPPVAVSVLGPDGAIVYAGQGP